VKAALKDQLGLGNVMQVPKIEKIVINMGVGKATQQPSLLEGAVRDLTMMSGQKPIITKAKNSIAGFKLREGQSIGCKVTLRGDRMWEFLDRLIAVAIPRIRDFRGLPAHSWDGRGNYTFGLSEQTVFPEIDYDKIDAQRGMDITIVTTATPTSRARPSSMRSASRSSAAPTRSPLPKKAKRRGPVRGGKGAPSQDRRRRRRSKGRAPTWQRSRRSTRPTPSPSTRCVATRVAAVAVAPVPSTASSASAGSACVRWLTRARSRA
jgi:large subunit ribosomal protein L5